MNKEESAKEYVKKNTFHDIDNVMYDAYVAGFIHGSLDTHDLVLVQERLNDVIDVKDKLYFKCEALQQENDGLKEVLRITQIGMQAEIEQIEKRELGVVGQRKDFRMALKVERDKNKILEEQIKDLKAKIRGMQTTLNIYKNE
jgi:hypothetical protein